MKRIRLLSCILAALILMSAVPMAAVAEKPETDAAATLIEEQETTGAIVEEETDGDKKSENEIVLEDIEPYALYEKKLKDTGATAGIKLSGKADATDPFVFEFDVDEEGVYTLSFVYEYIVGGNKNTTYNLFIDGEVPFQEAANRTLSRMWMNETDIKEDPNSGDDINPKQVEAQIPRSYTLYDKEGYFDTPLKFYLTKGKHTLTFDMSNENVKLNEVTFVGAAELPSYDAFLKQHAADTKYGGENVVEQGEDALYKSEMFLIAQNDITNPLTQPYSPAKIKLNTFGGANWKLTGETVHWEVEAPMAGLYKLSIRYRQNFYDGVSAHRRLYINGEVQYKEANALEFPYANVWQTYTLQDEAGNDLYVYLDAGVNDIALEVMLGSSAKIAEQMQESVLEMNTIYRQIIMITGSSPDDYRDYNIDTQIPTIVQDLTNARNRLADISAEVAKQYGEKSSLIAKIDNILRQLDLMIEKPAQISKSDRLSSFKSNISTVGSWISMFREQPLEIDRMEFYGDNSQAPRAEANFGESFKHSFDRFVASFTEDYSSMGSSTEGTTSSVKVWIQSGRDQANILKQLINSDFTPNTGVGVELELVTGAIIEATLAGKGPDVALTRAVTDPVNFAMRNALYDLSTFEDYEEVTKNFVDGAMIPFEYKKNDHTGVYALPETMSYQMMFVRTDITDELKLGYQEVLDKKTGEVVVDDNGEAVLEKKPDYWNNLTWDELLTNIYPIVSRNNMEIGIGNMNQIAAMNASNVFTNLLYQMGGQIYNDEGTATALNTQVAYQAFNKSVELYADYLFPQEYDAMSRFRTGEMPILLADYTMYNVFSISIPELDGLWEMYPIPGVAKVDENGNLEVDNSQAATTTACIMFGDANDTSEEAVAKANAGWEFLKWWVSEDTQAEFGIRVEAVLGSGGRYATANKYSMKKLPWEDDQMVALEDQMSSLVFVEQLPGSYFTSRAINSAFMTSVLNSENPTEQLLYWSEQIDLELTRKIEEFSD